VSKIDPAPAPRNKRITWPCTGSSGTSNSSAPVSANLACSDGSSNTQAIASTNAGILGGSSHAGNGSGTSLPAAGGTHTIFTDGIVFHSSNPGDTQVTVSVNAWAHGNLSDAGLDIVGADASVRIALGAGSVLADSFDLSESDFSCTTSLGTLSGCSDPVDAVLVSIPVVVPLDTPVFFSMELTTRACQRRIFRLDRRCGFWRYAATANDRPRRSRSAIARIAVS
jgi:hypothetical protein